MPDVPAIVRKRQAAGSEVAVFEYGVARAVRVDGGKHIGFASDPPRVCVRAERNPDEPTPHVFGSRDRITRGWADRACLAVRKLPATAVARHAVLRDVEAVDPADRGTSHFPHRGDVGKNVVRFAVTLTCAIGAKLSPRQVSRVERAVELTA